MSGMGFCYVVICASALVCNLATTFGIKRASIASHAGFISCGHNVSAYRPSRIADSNAANDFPADVGWDTDDLVLPNKYYKRSKHSKVGFKGGLRKEVETQEERLARTFNIFAPMPKEELMSTSSRPNAPDPDLVADINKYIKHHIEKEKQESAKLAGSGSSPPRKSEKPPKPLAKPVAAPDPQPQVKCPNAILLDKSILFSTPLDEYIVIGKILSPHGLRGHVKVRSLCSNPEIKLCEPGYRFLKFPNRDETVMPIKIDSGKLLDGEKTYRLKLEGVDTKDQALRLNGAFLSVSIRDVPPLEEDCYYSRDILNLNVYLFNDKTKTCLGKVVGFWHREDLVHHPKLANLTEDLIEVEMDIRLSLQTLLALTKRSAELDGETPAASEVVKSKKVTVVTDRDLDMADDVIDAEEVLANSNMMGVHYVKYYTCSICNREFTNYSIALEHDRAHDAGVVTESPDHEHVSNGQEAQSTKGEQIYTLDEYYEKEIKKPVRRFYIPLIKEETIKFVDVPNNSLYVDTFTVFIGEDGNKVAK
ncbi:16S rRNA processing protein RimM domain containing protein, putative [Babesia bigemina]|uniref:16S rRNA processing protein RimM domain containing protein, putative n=1 Tax=Babesia bigemina TaxID=5866 RepID=A0A061D9H4_BABBI|nr:16S rRNA processing protein RimM domain containing protein, putative [Babesia bigemina]CDR96642.1 16S rRNA processing protein RimM domain containing protein, putative [Babesia bigemina]|eukprot:XP_012768828.1 16S rRNA processing protein RimM domain containing protein, putative [Babesia bigemina]